jgi:hypothetical protein
MCKWNSIVNYLGYTDISTVKNLGIILLSCVVFIYVWMYVCMYRANLVNLLTVNKHFITLL